MYLQALKGEVNLVGCTGSLLADGVRDALLGSNNRFLSCFICNK